MNKDALMSFLSSLVVLAVGLLIGFVILLVSNASSAWEAFRTILTFGFRGIRNVGDVLLGATPIIMTGLSVAFAFKTGLFNIGATGQFAFGGLVAILVGHNFEGLPNGLRIILALLAATAAGAAWGAIPGLLKAFRNVHEVISCIMTNYIGMFLVTFLVDRYAFNPAIGRSQALPEGSNLPTLGFQYIFREEFLPGFYRSSQVNVGILIAIFTAILMYIILEKTTFGYELKACGFNKDAAKYAGINQNRSIVASMMIAGGLAGLGGALLYTSGTETMSAANVLLPYGFTGISVAFLGLSNPIGIIFSGTLVSYLFLGGARTQVLGFSIEVVEIVISVIIYFCAFVFLVKTFLGKHIGRLLRRGKSPEQDRADKGGESA
ncbi:MAG: ABC transporter permease [Defluviitaleaceae bacterium]|nr:ABC transporter permease [Defluviitaleaceae bacterium]MCL2239834.1 ABC transporter permease [Defluviitaleaceae bacterium]